MIRMSFRERYLNRHMILEMAPVAVFFLVNWGWGIMPATAAVMVATVICVAMNWARERRVPAMGIITVIMILVLGGLGLVLDDDWFIKIKLTIGKLLFAVILICGLYLKPTILERALGSFIFLTQRGWKVLTWRWVGLVVFWALANEVARRVLSTDDWVTFVTVLSVASIASYIIVTRLTAPAYWNGPEDEKVDAAS
jgi:intracellular septation protein